MFIYIYLISKRNIWEKKIQKVIDVQDMQEFDRLDRFRTNMMN